MKTVLSCLAILLLCTVCLVAGDDFCDDSSADTKIITKSLFNKEKDVFKTAYSWFKGRTAHTDMSSDAELTTLANDLITYVNEEIGNSNISFIVVRSTGAIIIDITQSPPIYPNIENHNTRYEVGKPMLCREFGTIVFNHYWVKRVNATYRFYGKAVQTGLDNEWFVFRINIPFTTFPAH